MSRELLVDRSDTHRRAVLLADGRLQAIEIDRIDRPSLVGAVHRALPDHHRAGIGQFMRLADGTRALLSGSQPINGPVLVQIKQDAIGDKAARATTDIALPGRFVVALPNATGIRFSRRFAGEGRAALSRLLEPLAGGWIVRAAASEADPSLIETEARALSSGWAALPMGDAAAALIDAPTAPFRLLQEDAAGLERIEFDGNEDADAVARWAEHAAPDLASRIRRYRGTPSLFALRDLDAEIAALTEPTVQLSGGGKLTIETTRALTAIDVDSGTAPPLATNLAAAGEIARQLRLRHIAGLIVVDFVSMRAVRDQGAVERTLAQGLARDPVGTQMLPMSKFGLVEIARERRGRPLKELLS